jgi:hypothetical protein
MDLGFPDAKNPRQRFDRKAVASNVFHLQAVPAQCTTNRVRAATENAPGLFHGSSGQRLAQSFNFFFAPAAMLVSALQAELKDEAPTCLSGAACLPLQATNELIELWT